MTSIEDNKFKYINRSLNLHIECIKIESDLTIDDTLTLTIEYLEYYYTKEQSPVIDIFYINKRTFDAYKCKLLNSDYAVLSYSRNNLRYSIQDPDIVKDVNLAIDIIKKKKEFDELKVTEQSLAMLMFNKKEEFIEKVNTILNSEYRNNYFYLELFLRVSKWNKSDVANWETIKFHLNQLYNNNRLLDKDDLKFINMVD